MSCYANDSIILPDYGPCNTSGRTTFCCVQGQICLSNGLCGTELGTFYNGGCTDESYKAAICPRFCQSGTSPWSHRLENAQLMMFVESAQFIVECKGGAVKDGDFCCSSDGKLDCCNDRKTGLGLAASSSSTTAAAANPSSTTKGLRSQSLSTVSSTTPSTTRSSSSTSASPARMPFLFGTMTTVEGSASTITYTVMSLTATGPVEPAYTPLHSSAPNQVIERPSQHLQIGLGLGIALTLVITIALCILYWSKHFSTTSTPAEGAARIAKKTTFEKFKGAFAKKKTPAHTQDDEHELKETQATTMPNPPELDSESLKELDPQTYHSPLSGSRNPANMEPAELSTDGEIHPSNPPHTRPKYHSWSGFGGYDGAASTQTISTLATTHSRRLARTFLHTHRWAQTVDPDDRPATPRTCTPSPTKPDRAEATAPVAHRTRRSALKAASFHLGPPPGLHEPDTPDQQRSVTDPTDVRPHGSDQRVSALDLGIVVKHFSSHGQTAELEMTTAERPCVHRERPRVCRLGMKPDCGGCGGGGGLHDGDFDERALFPHGGVDGGG